MMLAKCLPVTQGFAHGVRAHLAQSGRRAFRAMPRVLAQAEKAGESQKEEPTSLQASRPEPSGALASWDAFPSFGRMGQMMRQLEDEMNAMTRAFGLPALQTTFDLPSVAFPEVPATARALACDIQDKGDHIQVQADVPGMSKDEIKITVSPDKVLQISGERKYEKEEGSKEGEGVWRVERSYGSFVRRFRLPDNVDPEGIKAQVKDGVLKLSVPKTQEVKPKIINVQMSEE